MSKKRDFLIKINEKMLFAFLEKILRNLASSRVRTQDSYPSLLLAQVATEKREAEKVNPVPGGVSCYRPDVSRCFSSCLVSFRLDVEPGDGRDILFRRRGGGGGAPAGGGETGPPSEIR